jgi:hypothetical protein
MSKQSLVQSLTYLNIDRERTGTVQFEERCPGL